MSKSNDSTMGGKGREGKRREGIFERKCFCKRRLRIGKRLMNHERFEEEDPVKTPSVYRANKFLELDLHVVGKLWPTGIETAGVC